VLSQIIEELVNDAGMTEAEIASSVGSTQPTINRIRRGAGTNFDLGNRLVELHRARGPFAAVPEPQRSEGTA